MKWKKADIGQYLQAKEYIDTILLPLVPYQMSSDEETEKTAVQSEIMTIFANGIEQELTGRILLAPSYNYLKPANREIEVERINAWAEEMKQQPFSHIILLTFDSGWKKFERDLTSNLLWMPAVQAGDVRSKEMQGIIREQVGQTVDLIRTYWE